MTKKMASDAMKAKIPALFFSTVRSGGGFSAAFLSSVFSGCAKSHRGRRPRMGGSHLKLSAGGGEVVAHSRVQAFQGLFPAGFPQRRLANIFQSSTRTEMPRMNAPMVDSMFQSVQ